MADIRSIQDVVTLVTEVKAETDTLYASLDAKAWEEKIKSRAVNIVPTKSLRDNTSHYAEEIKELRKQLLLGVQVEVENPDGSLKSVAEVMALKADEEAGIQTRLDRLLDKFAACQKEISLREAKLVTREVL